MRNLSNDWKQRTLAETCHILAGFGFPERLQGKSSGDFPFYKVGDISETWKRGDIYLTSANHYLDRSEVIEIRARPLPKDTTVFAKIGAAIALNRRAILSVPALVDNNVMGLHPATDDLDPKFLFYFVCTLKLDELSRATTVPSVRKSDIEQIQIPVPPISEQRQIVEEIEKQFTRLDAGVAALRRTQANLKRYRAAVLKAACEGQLVPTEAERAKQQSSKRGSIPREVGTPVVESGATLLERILDERRKKWSGRGKYKEPVAPDLTNLAPLPNGWTWASPEQISSADAYSLSIGPFGSNLKVSDYTDAGVPLIFVRNIRSEIFCGDRTVFVSKAKAADLKAHQVSGGDILVTKMGVPPGDACLYPEAGPDAIITADCIKLRPSPLLTSKRFFLHAINSEIVKPQILNITKGVAQMKVSLGRFGSVALPLPPLTEQTRIVAEVERRLSVVEELETVVNANLKRATRLRQSILQQAFSGENGDTAIH